ncbi:hypothetical protein V2J09_002933 [Rumex salicifolius]
MSTVDKMLIKGIRSFDPENKNVITFFKPLTLIVGPNGAGKTTIIESLKLSCTGELPPNARSGQSFIHDPKVAGETETKAQIKLRFKTAAGKDVVCIRSFQLTQKASKMEYKAIESVLQTLNPHTGEKVCLSYRCADMDREIPALMGVSKAILENVIFVHQDEANWPLQDPSTLKKKFDDIFSATRYTKALEVIKKLHKEQAQEIKTYKLKLENLQTLKDAAYKLRESIGQDQERKVALTNQMKDLETEIGDVEVKIHHVETNLKGLRKLQDQINAKTAERSSKFQQQQDLYADLEEENEDTDEELREWKTKFDEGIAHLESKISKLERKKDDTKTESSKHRDKEIASIKEISKLEADILAYKSWKKERDSTIQNLFEKYNLGPLLHAPFSDEVASELTDLINKRLVEMKNDLQDKKESIEKELVVEWEQYEVANSRCKDIDAAKSAKVEMKSDVLRRLIEKKADRDRYESEISNINLAHLDEREKKMHNEIERKTNQLHKGDFDEVIKRKKSELFNIGQEIKALTREKDALLLDSEATIKLSFKKPEIDEHKDKIRGVFKGRLPVDKDLKEEIGKALRSINEEYKDLTSKSSEVEKKVNFVQMKIQELEISLSKLHKDKDSRKRCIESKLQSLGCQSYSVGSYIQALDKAKENRDRHKRAYNVIEGLSEMFDPFEKLARENHNCPCCDRPFSAEEEDAFVQKQRATASSKAERTRALAAQSSSADSIFQQLDKLRVIYEEYEKINKDTIPSSEKNLDELNEELEQSSQALDDILGVLAQVKADKDSVEALVQPIEDANRLLQEIPKLQEEVDDLLCTLDMPGKGVRSMDEIQCMLNALQENEMTLRNDIEKLQEEQKYLMTDLSSIQVRWHSLREKIMETTTKLSKIEVLDSEIERLSEEKKQRELEEKHLSESLGPLLKETEKLRSNYDISKSRLHNELEEQNTFIASFEQDINELLRNSSKIIEYKVERKEKLLKELQENLLASRSLIQRCEKENKEISAELDKSKDLKRSQDHLKRNIEDNLKYRNVKAEVDNLTHEIESLEEGILKSGGISATEAELVKLTKERERLLSEHNRCHGTLSVYESNISKNKVDLKQTQYKDIDNRYFDQLIQLKVATTEMANKDLDRYYNALDKALMRFHTMKMEEINKIIRELWQQTYRGQDIDYIYIHSDSEGAGTRSYSYKVLMQTGDTELEMRGRCSAGQKVLASLIIRLALAETFCLNCGILALDEPTTNLDGPNSESLAAALLRIMEDRKGQENFQLIVITHDERFAQLIGQRQHAEKYYRVTKDDHQHSIIEPQEIFD